MSDCYPCGATSYDVLISGVGDGFKDDHEDWGSIRTSDGLTCSSKGHWLLSPQTDQLLLTGLLAMLVRSKLAMAEGGFCAANPKVAYAGWRGSSGPLAAQHGLSLYLNLSQMTRILGLRSSDKHAA